MLHIGGDDHLPVFGRECVCVCKRILSTDDEAINFTGWREDKFMGEKAGFCLLRDLEISVECFLTL